MTESRARSKLPPLQHHNAKSDVKLSGNPIWDASIHAISIKHEVLEDYLSSVLEGTGGAVVKGILRSPILAANLVSYYNEVRIQGCENPFYTR